jgi:hypothetical protein
VLEREVLYRRSDSCESPARGAVRLRKYQRDIMAGAKERRESFSREFGGTREN